MEDKKMLTEEELKNSAGGAQMFEDYDPPKNCLVCGAPMTKHPRYGDINGFPLFACSSNVWDENHQLVWRKLERR